MPRKGPPYVSIRADAPLDSRWTADLWFAWSRILGTCRLKRAVTSETWPAAVLRLRPLEAASILNTTPNWVAKTLANLSQVASLTAHKEDAKGGAIWVVKVHNYAEYQKLGRPTSDTSNDEHRDPPSVPPSLRPSVEEEEGRRAAHAALPTARLNPPSIRGLECDRLPMATARRLLDVRPQGVEWSEDDLAAWFAVKAPVMRARGNRDLSRTAAKWWPRVKREEIEEARRWVNTRQIDVVKRACEAAPAPTVDDDFEIHMETL